MTGGPALATGGVAAGAPARILAQVPNGPSSPQSARAAAPRFCLTAVAGDTQVQLRWFPSAPGEDLAIHYGTEQDVRTRTVSVATSALVDKLKNEAHVRLLARRRRQGPERGVERGVGHPVGDAVSAHMVLPDGCRGRHAGALEMVPGCAGKGLRHLRGTEPDSNTAGKIRAATGTSALVDELADGTALVNGTTYNFWLVGEGDGPRPPMAPA